MKWDFACHEYLYKKSPCLDSSWNVNAKGEEADFFNSTFYKSFSLLSKSQKILCSFIANS